MAFETFIDNFDDKVGIWQCFYYHPSSPNIFLLGQKKQGLPDTEPKESIKEFVTTQPNYLLKTKFYLTKLENITVNYSAVKISGPSFVIATECSK